MKAKGNIVSDFQSLKEQLATHGLKVTPQRLTIYQYLLQTENHPSAEQVFEKTSHACPGLSMATVYKTLDALTDAGLVRKVQTADDLMRFDAKTGSHNHLYCSSTKTIMDFNDPELQGLLDGYFARKRFKNFKVSDYQLQVNGTIVDKDKRVKLKQSK